MALKVHINVPECVLLVTMLPINPCTVVQNILMPPLVLLFHTFANYILTLRVAPLPVQKCMQIVFLYANSYFSAACAENGNFTQRKNGPRTVESSTADTA